MSAAGKPSAKEPGALPEAANSIPPAPNPPLPIAATSIRYGFAAVPEAAWLASCQAYRTLHPIPELPPPVAPIQMASSIAAVSSRFPETQVSRPESIGPTLPLAIPAAWHRSEVKTLQLRSFSYLRCAHAPDTSTPNLK